MTNTPRRKAPNRNIVLEEITALRDLPLRMRLLVVGLCCGLAAALAEAAQHSLDQPLVLAAEGIGIVLLFGFGIWTLVGRREKKPKEPRSNG